MSNSHWHNWHIQLAAINDLTSTVIREPFAHRQDSFQVSDFPGVIAIQALRLFEQAQNLLLVDCLHVWQLKPRIFL